MLAQKLGSSHTVRVQENQHIILSEFSTIIPLACHIRPSGQQLGVVLITEGSKLLSSTLGTVVNDDNFLLPVKLVPSDLQALQQFSYQMDAPACGNHHRNTQ
jgi:hypothetical protein